MKKAIPLLILLFVFCFFMVDVAQAQCSICTRAASQLSEQSAEGLNTGIIYLAAIPYITVSIIVIYWLRKNKVRKTTGQQ